jgi:hypothetical protein
MEGVADREETTGKKRRHRFDPCIMLCRFVEDTAIYS